MLYEHNLIETKQAPPASSCYSEPLRYAMASFGILTLLALCAAAQIDPPDPRPALLQKGVRVQAELAGGNLYSYDIPLDSNQFLDLVVQQQGIDIVLTLKDPSGHPLLEADSPTEAWGPEPLFVIASAPGAHRIEIRPLEPDAPAGHYEILIQDLRPATPEDEDRVEAQQAFLKGQTLLYSSRSAKKLRAAIQELTKALALQVSLNDRRGQSWTLYALGLAHSKLGEQKQALDYHLRSLPLRGEAGTPNAEGNSLQSIGVAYKELGEMNRALDSFSKALEVRRKNGDRLGQGVTLHSLGTLYQDLDQFDEAFQYFNEALTLSRDLGDREGEFNAFNSIGHLYSKLGEEEQALHSFEQALAIGRELGLRMEEALAVNSLGKVELKRGNPAKALQRFQEALSIFRSTGFLPGEAQALLNIGSVLMTLQDFTEASASLEQGLAIAQRIGRRGQEADARVLLGTLYARMNRPEPARKELFNALSIYRALGNRIDEASSQFALARLTRRDEGPEAALPPTREALKLLESVRADLSREDFRILFFDTKQEYYAFLVDLQMELDRQHSGTGHLAFALETNEKARARSLLDTLSEIAATIRHGADPKLTERESTLQRKLNLAEQRRMHLLEGGSSDTEKLVSMDQEIDGLLKDLDGIRAEIRARSPRYAALTQPEPLRAEEIQALLGPGDLLLSYFLGEERSFVWAVTRSSLTAHEIPSRGEIESTAKELHDLLSQSDKRLARRPTEQAAARLADMILAPVQKKLGKNRLVIVADGALHYIPFAALPDPARPGQPLVVEHEIVNLPSASVLALLRKETGQRAPAPREVAILADPVFRLNDPRVQPQTASLSLEPPAETGIVLRAAKDVGLDGFPRLRYTREEADAIASLVEPGQVLKALDFEASKETATSGDLARYRILHFATHGLLDTRRPELSGLVLSLVDRQGRPRDGFLRLHEIYNLDLPADLVVLSGCETALGKEVRGEGLMALTRGFMYAGSPAVVASLWQIDDRSTGELMKRFYRGMIQEGLSAPAALRKAQVSLWKDRPTEPPYFWAGFVFQGDWRITVH